MKQTVGNDTIWKKRTHEQKKKKLRSVSSSQTGECSITVRIKAGTLCAPDGPTAAPSEGLTIWRRILAVNRELSRFPFIVPSIINKEWKARGELAAGGTSPRRNVNDGEDGESNFLLTPANCCVPLWRPSNLENTYHCGLSFVCVL